MAKEQIQGKEIQLEYTTKPDQALAMMIFNDDTIVAELTKEFFFEIKSISQEQGKTTITVCGNKSARHFLSDIMAVLKNDHYYGRLINAETVRYNVERMTKNMNKAKKDFAGVSNDNPRSSRNTMPITEGHREYKRALHKCDLIVATGKAGTGKTFTALEVGIELLESNKISQIVCIRPAQEMGEKIGAEPGDAQQKISRFMQPFMQNLKKICSPQALEKYISSGKIIFQPLGSTRGLTFDNAYIIIDEAQNIEARSQNEQQDSVLETLVSRAGYGTKVVVAGSLEQVDVRRSALHGLVTMVEFGIAANVQIPDGAVKTHIQRLTAADVIRSPLAKYMAAVREAMEAQQAKPQPSSAPQRPQKAPGQG